MQRLKTLGLAKQRSGASGVTLIELVIALVIIGISAATIASLLTTALNFAETNKSYAKQLRDAETCYETLLAVTESNQWVDNQPADGCSAGPLEVTAGRLSDWTKENTYDQLFVSSVGSDVCVPQPPTCKAITIDGQSATKLTVPVRGINDIQFIVPP